MSKNTQSNSNNGIANLTDLQNVLGVKMEKKTTTTKTLTEKAQVMKQVNEAMDELLITKFPQYFKHIETDVVVTSKDGTHKLQRLSGWYLLFPQDKEINNKTHQGFKVCKPTTYVKGGNSYWCSYVKEIGKTTFNK